MLLLLKPAARDDAQKGRHIVCSLCQGIWPLSPGLYSQGVNKGVNMKSENIKRLRQTLSLSQRDFAEKIGVKRLTIARWESGIRKPDKENQERLTKFAKENGLDTKIVSSDQENVSTKDELDTKNVSSEDTKLDTKLDTNWIQIHRWIQKMYPVRIQSWIQNWIQNWIQTGYKFTGGYKKCIQ